MALSKAERTRQFIIETVAPVFSKNGYIGTSMSDLEVATGMTKGAIYGNFKNKENLALSAFNYSLHNIMRPLNAKVNAETDAISKLKAITDFYRHYYQTHMESMGGCAILNVSIDTHHQNPVLFTRVQDVIRKLKKAIENIIDLGKQEAHIKKGIHTEKYASKIYGMIQGSIFLTMTLNEDRYLTDMMDHIDQMIDSEMKS